MPGGSELGDSSDPAIDSSPGSDRILTTSGVSGSCGCCSICTEMVMGGRKSSRDARARTARRLPACGRTCRSRSGPAGGSAAAISSFRNDSGTGIDSEARAPLTSANREARSRSRISISRGSIHQDPAGPFSASMKNSIMRSVLIPLWPRSGPTCRSKLLPAPCSALMSCIMFDGWTLLSAVPQ